MSTPAALTIAGSDSGGGAGIQADLKTFSALGVYGASAITLVTAQNTRGVRGVALMEPGVVADQIAAVLEDIAIGAVKIGALGAETIVEEVADALADFPGPVVLDPVMVAKSGDSLLAEGAVRALRDRLLPRATLVTPNLPEAARLTGRPLAETETEITAQGTALVEAGAQAALVKGGHAEGSESRDILFRPGEAPMIFRAPRIATRNTHGTGCTLSAAIAARLALGDGLETAIGAARDWLQGALAAADELGIGGGHGPLHHFHALWPPRVSGGETRD
jgi:hydroxymethylpyrimidine/phosphomethylpyrimidine kinase